jgi:predicted acetyltransferase
MKHLHVRSDMRGDAVTMLYAFRHGYYAKLGYAVATSRKRLEIDPRSIPDAWRVLARGRVRSAKGDDRDAIVRAYLRNAAQVSGWLVRPDTLWERLFTRERRQHLVVPAANGELAGYVAFDITQDAFHEPTTLTVGEVIADDDATRHALLGALGAMRDQVTEIVLEVAADDPIELAFIDSDRHRFGTAEVEHPLGTIVGGPMVRIEDVARAVEARGYASAGSTAFDLVVREEADEVAISVTIEDGRATAAAAKGGGAIRTSRRGLAAILYGGTGLGDAVRLGWAEADARVRSRAEVALAMAPLVPIDPF